MSKTIFYLPHKIYSNVHKLVLYNPIITHNYHVIISSYAQYYIKLEIYLSSKTHFYPQKKKIKVKFSIFLHVKNNFVSPTQNLFIHSKISII